MHTNYKKENMQVYAKTIGKSLLKQPISEGINDTIAQPIRCKWTMLLNIPVSPLRMRVLQCDALFLSNKRNQLYGQIIICPYLL